jgi:hypothetical protein
MEYNEVTKRNIITAYVDDGLRDRFEKVLSLRAEVSGLGTEISRSSFAGRLLKLGLEVEEKTLEQEKETKTRVKKESKG